MSDHQDFDTAHAMAMQAVGFAALLLAPHADAFAALIRADGHVHGHLHIAYPPANRRDITSDRLRQQVTLASVALAFVREVQKVKDEVERGAEP